MARRNTHTYHWQRSRIEDQVTQPLPIGNLAFRSYLSAHHLNSLDAARLTGVLYITTWNIEQNNPVSAANAAVVRAGLRRTTGVAYTGPIKVHADTHATTRRRRDHETI